MPTPKNIAQFPKQWLDLINAVSTNGRTVTVTDLGGVSMSKGQASKLRFRFYSIRSLLRRDPMQQDLAALSEGVEVTIHEQTCGSLQGFVTRFAPRDNNKEALALKKALEV